MASYDDGDGVWRTIGGRRIFIRDGESLSSAMKKSGKFKSAKKRIPDVEEAKKLNESERERVINREKERENYEEDKQKYLEISQEERVKAAEEGKDWKDLVKEKEYSMDGKKISEDDIKSEYDREKARGNIDKDMSYEDYKKSVVDDRNSNIRSTNKSDSSNVKSQQSDIEKASGLKVKEAFETDLYGNGKADRFKLDDGRFIEHTKEAMGQKRDDWSINKIENGEIKSQNFKNYDDMIKHLNNNSGSTSTPLLQKSDIERASGLKVKEAFQSDLYGNGKEDRFKLEDGRIVSHTKNAMGKETDQWSIGKLENGSMNEKTFKSYDEMIDHLKGGSGKSVDSSGDAKAILDKYRTEFKNRETSEFDIKRLSKSKNHGVLLGGGKHGEDVKMGDDGKLHSIPKNQFKKLPGSNDKLYVGESGTNEFYEGVTNAYKKAFQEYKKQHPNSKLTLIKFIKIAEGD